MSTPGQHVAECPKPSPRRRDANRLWICPDCGQGWVANYRQPPNTAPTGLSLWWHKWPGDRGTT